jgi:ribosomal protein S12 methylthiotransferase accessory factor
MLTLGGDGTGIKTYRRGTHRTLAPDDTIGRLRPLMAAFGITRIANLTGLDRTGIPVVMVCRPNARSSAVFHGKGIDMAAAKASGLMEAIETWHAEHVQLPLRFGSFADLRPTCKLVEVAGLPRAPAGEFHFNLTMLWTEGHDLIGDDRVWLPFETVHSNLTKSGPPSSGCFAGSTNGLASGNHFLEAVSHALCEVIERDATSLWHQSHPEIQDRTRIDLATITDGTCCAVLNRLAGTGIDAAVWDITTDIGVPAFQCLVMDRTGEIGHVGHGAGCHATREIALLRALTEAVQVRTTYIVGSREDIEYADYRQATVDARSRSVRALLRPVNRMRDFGSIGRFEFEDFHSEVAWILDRLSAAGVRQAIAVDLTRHEFGVPVVRVVVPGLEGSDHHPAYVPGARARAIRERRP